MTQENKKKYTTPVVEELSVRVESGYFSSLEAVTEGETIDDAFGFGAQGRMIYS
jgi:hypothetical protein